MKKVKQGLPFFIAILFVMSLSGCKPKQIIVDEADESTVETVEVMGDNEPLPCAYTAIKGKAKIVQLNSSNVDEIIIKFDFMPSEKYTSAYPELTDKGQIFNVEGVGKYPPRSWALAQGIEQGAEIDCVKYELKGGEAHETYCEKVKYDFPQFKDKSWR
jgi:hypothetical protein